MVKNIDNLVKNYNKPLFTKLGLVTAVLVTVLIGGLSMPQMIGLANAQSQQAVEQACPRGFATLSQGQCIGPVIYVCQPRTVGGFPARSDDSTCIAQGPSDALQPACAQIPGSTFIPPLPSPDPETEGSATCTFPATPSCPGGITPTDGQCVTRPGEK